MPPCRPLRQVSRARTRRPKSRSTLRGRFLYGSNRGHDSIAVLPDPSGQRRADAHRAYAHARRGPDTSRSIPPAAGSSLRATRDSNSLAVFRVDQTGERSRPSAISCRLAAVCVSSLADLIRQFVIRIVIASHSLLSSSGASTHVRCGDGGTMKRGLLSCGLGLGLLAGCEPAIAAGSGA